MLNVDTAGFVVLIMLQILPLCMFSVTSARRYCKSSCLLVCVLTYAGADYLKND